jgi:hypothetical protein
MSSHARKAAHGFAAALTGLRALGEGHAAASTTDLRQVTMEVHGYLRVFIVVRVAALAYRIGVGLVSLAAPAFKHLGDFLRNPVWKAVSLRRMNRYTRKAHCIITLLPFALLLAACSGGRAPLSGPIPTPRDLTSPAELSPELATLRIPWAGEQVEGPAVALINLDGRDPQQISLPEYAVTPSLSPSTRYVVYVATLLPEADVELLDFQTQERHILVRGKERFPGAILANPSFSPDEAQVVFEVKWSDRIDLAIVDVASEKVQYLDLGGGLNMWPEISPDGKWILIACENPTQSEFSFCLLDQAQRVRRYLVNDVVPRNGKFSPDGQLVAYIAMAGGVMGEGQLYRVGQDGNDKIRLVSGLFPGEEILSLTPEDVVFSCTYPGQPACSWVCVVGLDGSDVRRLTYLGERCIDVNAP